MKSKTVFIKTVLVIFLFHSVYFKTAAQPWTSLPSLPVTGRDQNMGFSVNGKGYVCGGYTGGPIIRETWEFDPVSNAWTQKADMPDDNNGAAGFAIGNYGYIAGGYNYNSSEMDVLWSYDPLNNLWNAKTPFVTARANGALAWSIDGKGYIGCGWDGMDHTSDVWEYDPVADAWTQVASFPGGKRGWVVCFVINGMGYAGLGEYPSTITQNDFYQYDPLLNTWNPCSSFPGTPRFWSLGFSVGGKGYTGCGASGMSTLLDDWWQYDPATGSWERLCNFGGGNRALGAAFVINNEGYFGTGRMSPTVPMNDFWKFNPLQQPYPVITGDTVLCAGDTVLLSSGGAAGYLWNNGSTTSSILVAPAASGFYSVTATSGNCIMTDSIFITVYPLPAQPQIILLNDTLFCTGSAVQYQWYLDGNIITGAQSAFITNLTAGTYTVAVTDTNGCSIFSLPFIFTAIPFMNGRSCFNVWHTGKQLQLHYCNMISNDKIRVELFNTMGSLVLQKNISFPPGSSSVETVSLTELRNGIYFIHVTSRSLTLTSKFILND